MVIERMFALDGGRREAILISDEVGVLEDALARGIPVLGIAQNGPLPFCVPYVAASWEALNEEVLVRALKRQLFLPWEIARTKRVCIRELVPEDAAAIPCEEKASLEPAFRDRASLWRYIRTQYRFYEYGIWAVVLRFPDKLAGLAGVCNPDAQTAAFLGEDSAYLELGYHIFERFRGRGYAKEALEAIRTFSHRSLGVRLAARIETANKASRRLAEGLGLSIVGFSGGEGTFSAVCEKGIQSAGGCLLYAENCEQPPGKADPSQPRKAE